MNGTIGFCGTMSLPLLIVIFAPFSGGVTLGLAAVDMRFSPGGSPAAGSAARAQMLAHGRPRSGRVPGGVRL